jgi:type II secretory ATPase GspE/PulE/Tfp pilus assembly ATPase PilB-like protein
MAEMDIAERRRPQDGRIALKVKDRPVDIRVATLPTPNGEAVVMRVLNTELAFHSIDDLGLSPRHQELLLRLIKKPYGALVLAGPTGSGKTTTLYAGLKELNTPDRKCITIEDPIEYAMAGVTQMSINPKIGLSFAQLLRTVLRSDPDVVMVGEVRDPETAEIAVRAALTGHLVLSSLHTNDAPSALTRLVDMGVPAYVTSSALLGVVAQRLVRILCPECKAPDNLSQERLLAAGFCEEELEFLTPYKAVGCDKCGQAGYRGRVGAFEIMEMDDELTRVFLREAPSEELRALALSRGMVSLRRDALDKVADGTTSLEEIDRVVN